MRAWDSPALSGQCAGHAVAGGALARCQGRPQSPGMAGRARHRVAGAAQSGWSPACPRHEATASEGTPQTGQEDPRGPGQRESDGRFVQVAHEPGLPPPRPQPEDGYILARCLKLPKIMCIFFLLKSNFTEGTSLSGITIKEILSAAS